MFVLRQERAEPGEEIADMKEEVMEETLGIVAWRERESEGVRTE